MKNVDACGIKDQLLNTSHTQESDRDWQCGWPLFIDWPFFKQTNCVFKLTLFIVSVVGLLQSILMTSWLYSSSAC